MRITSTDVVYLVEKYLWGRILLWLANKTKVCCGEVSVGSNAFVTGKRSQNLLSTANTQSSFYMKYLSQYNSYFNELMLYKFLDLKLLCLADWLQTLVSTSVYFDNVRDGQTETARNGTIQEQYSVSGFRFPTVTVLNREIILEMVSGGGDVGFPFVQTTASGCNFQFYFNQVHNMRQETDMAPSISLQTHPHPCCFSFEWRTIHSGCCRWFQTRKMLDTTAATSASRSLWAVNKCNETSKIKPIELHSWPKLTYASQWALQ